MRVRIQNSRSFPIAFMRGGVRALPIKLFNLAMKLCAIECMKYCFWLISCWLPHLVAVGNPFKQLTAYYSSCEGHFLLWRHECELLSFVFSCLVIETQAKRLKVHCLVFWVIIKNCVENSDSGNYVSMTQWARYVWSKSKLNVVANLTHVSSEAIACLVLHSLRLLNA